MNRISTTFAPKFVADPADRFLTPNDPLQRNARRRFIAIIAIACLLHGGLLIWLLRRDHGQVPAEPQEVPVEVVVVPPPEPPKPQPKPEQPKPQPKEKPPPIDKRPATDTPPPANNEKLHAEQTEQATQSPLNGKPEPKAEMKPVPPAPEKPAQSAAAAPAERSAAPEVPEDKSDAEEALNKAEPLKNPKPTEKQKPAKERAPLPAHERQSLAREFAALSQSPRFSIAVEAKPSPVNGGRCTANPYLCVLYGLIMRQQHYPEVARAHHIVGTVVVAFWLDERGDLVHQALYRTSGHPELDAEALATIHRAAPFPPPPPNSPHGFIAQMEFPPK